MVNLAAVRERRSFAHLQTGIASLDHMVGLATNGIIDLQSVPGSTAAEAIVALYIAKHLEHSRTSHVVIIDCLRAFPMRLIGDRILLQGDNWQDRVHWYQDVGFARMEWLFGELASASARSDVLIVVNSFHEACNLYRNLLVLRAKETLLQFQTARNDELIQGLDRFKEEGTLPKLARLPPGSELLKVSPASKFDTHLTHLLSRMSLVAYSKNLLIILNGTMDVGWRAFETTEPLMLLPNNSLLPTQPPSSQMTSQGDRLLLTSLLPTARLSFVSSFSKTPAVNAYISKRILFYKDWYHRTIHFALRFQINETSHIQLDPKQLRAVYGAAVFAQNVSGSKHIGCVNFDFDNSFYRKFGTNVPNSPSQWGFIDLNSYQTPEPTWLSDSSDNEEEEEHEEDDLQTTANIPPSSPNIPSGGSQNVQEEHITTITPVNMTASDDNINKAPEAIADDSQLIGDSEEEELL